MSKIQTITLLSKAVHSTVEFSGQGDWLDEDELHDKYKDKVNGPQKVESIKKWGRQMVNIS